MPRSTCNFRQRDVTAAVKAVEAAGREAQRVRIDRNACIIIDLAVVGRSQQTSSTPSSRNSKRNMVAVDLKGVAKVTAKGRTYYYAWPFAVGRGWPGPRMTV